MKNILVRAPQWLGDAVVSTIFLAHIKQRHPDAGIDVWCYAPLAPVFESHPAVRRVLALPPKNLFSPTKAARALERDYDELFVLPRSLRAALEARFSKIPRRVGFAGPWRGLFFTETFSFDEELYYPNRYLKLIRQEQALVDAEKPYFPSTAPEPVVAAGLERASRPLLALAPSSIAPARTWDADKFGEVGRRFVKETGGSVILLGSPSEKERSARVAKAVGERVIDATGLLSLPQLGGVLKEASALVANDSGLMHVASAFGIPTVVVFGASEPAQALPRQGRHAALQHREVPCVPCLRNECVRFGDGHLECLKKAGVDEVWALLKRGGAL